MKKAGKIIRNILVTVALIMIIAVGYIQFHGAFSEDYLNNHEAREFGNSFLVDGTGVSAHRMGGGLFPEDTMMAAKGLMEDWKNGEYRVDVIEMDLWLTKDNQLIVMHDDTFDRVSDAEEVFGKKETRPADYTLEELRVLNLGENFVAPDGSTPYKGLRRENVPTDVQVVSLEEILDYLTAQGDFQYIIEIKDSGDRGIQAMDRLVEVAREYGIADVTLLSSFHKEVLYHVDEAYPDLHRHASTGEVAIFFRDFMLGKDPKNCNYSYDVLNHTPRYSILKGTDGYGMLHGLLPLCSQGYINRAHECGIAVYYWTVNDENTMRKLVSRNADGIITDYPNRMPQE